MTIPHFVVHHQQCESCGVTLYIGEECVLWEGGFFCDKDCVARFMLDGLMIKDVCLTDQEIWRAID